MNEPLHPEHDAHGPMSREEMMSALFANMIMQQINLGMMFLGKVPHPETGQHIQDLETARMFIDQLEMLQLKTRGNLSKDEASLMNQGLTSLRMAFVEATNAPGGGPPATPPVDLVEPSPLPEAAAPLPEAKTHPVEPPPAAAAAAAPEESRKKFSKKY